MRLKCEEPDKIVFTVACTATAREWELFREVLDESVMKSMLPKEMVYAFRNQVNDLLAQARRIYWASESSDGEKP